MKLFSSLIIRTTFFFRRNLKIRSLSSVFFLHIFYIIKDVVYHCRHEHNFPMSFYVVRFSVSWWSPEVSITEFKNWNGLMASVATVSDGVSWHILVPCMPNNYNYTNLLQNRSWHRQNWETITSYHPQFTLLFNIELTIAWSSDSHCKLHQCYMVTWYFDSLVSYYNKQFLLFKCLYDSSEYECYSQVIFKRSYIKNAYKETSDLMQGHIACKQTFVPNQ